MYRRGRPNIVDKNPDEYLVYQTDDHQMWLYCGRKRNFKTLSNLIGEEELNKLMGKRKDKQRIFADYLQLAAISLGEELS